MALSRAPLVWRCQRWTCLALWLLLAFPVCHSAGNQGFSTSLVQGTVWQPDTKTANPTGQWNRIGARQLLVQWTIVDDVAFVDGTGVAASQTMPDWRRIAKEPWAEEVILGLAGRFDGNLARKDLPRLVELSRQLSMLETPLKVVGWYFPVEVDSTWVGVQRLPEFLALLPRPLWISVYDNSNLGPDDFVNSLADWLPSDVGIFFQDGVGVHARTAAVAREYADKLATRFGKQRVKIIAEAFRPKVGGGFRSAIVEELLPQLMFYKGHAVYLFDGPHYVPVELVDKLLQDAARRRN